MSCDEFRRQLDRGLHKPDAQLFRIRIDVGDPAGGSGGRIRGYADLGAVAVIWEQQDDVGDSPVASSLIDGELRFGVGMPETEGMDPLPGTITDTAVGLLWWLQAADACAQREFGWELALDPADPAIADSLLPETAEPLRQRGEPLRARARFDQGGGLAEVVIDALMPPETPTPTARWTPWRTSIELIPTPRLPVQDLRAASGRDEVWRRCAERWPS
ncbi:hypothetical protein [Enemella evansiae]|uniref:hypothetical protein n=1 Tax=Enemella evansiae TaxID=2016499 RepID=UPI001060E72E|nr:hypothetical protein [Enemella evansiae]TDO93157.1 hypothetical protein C8D81_0936 [Enemella evansiae]